MIYFESAAVEKSANNFPIAIYCEHDKVNVENLARPTERRRGRPAAH